MQFSQNTHGISRRQLLAGLVSLGLAPELFAKLTPAIEQSQIEYWVSAQGMKANDYGLSWANKSDASLNTLLSGFRGHGISQHPVRKSNAIMFGRRPSTMMIEVDLVSGKLINQIECDKNRHLFGHGCFSRDGKLLITAESDMLTGQGKIVIRDANHYQLLDELDSYGIGPHEIKLMPQTDTLVIANGGILTHPESGRKKLNLDSMNSSLTYLNLKNGQLIAQVKVPENKASIRHLDVADDGTVVFAMQMQRQAAAHNNLVALTGTHRMGNKVKLLTAPDALVQSMNDYAGSVAINHQTRIAGITSPKGNLAAFWHIDTQRFMGYHQLADVCGIASSADQKHFVLSSSVGQLRFIDALTLQENRTLRMITKEFHWDNHLMSVLI